MIHSWLRKHFADARPKTIIELGANVGTDTVRLAALPGATVHALEPDPRNSVPPRDSIVFTRAAIAAIDGEAPFHLSNVAGKQWTCSSSLYEPTGHLTAYPAVKFDEQVTVKTVTLDTYAREHDLGVVDFIWADTQGGEADMIRGGRETLKRTRYLYTEYCEPALYAGQASLAELLAMLPGWRVVQKYPSGQAYADVLLENTAMTLPAPVPAPRPPPHEPNLSLIITGICNRTCPHCHNLIPYGAVFFQRHMPVGDIERCAAAMRPLDTLYVCGGEPTLHPDFASLAPRWRELFECRRLVLVSNGRRLVEHQAMWPHFDDIWVTDYKDDAHTQAALAALQASGRPFTRATSDHKPLLPSGGTKPCVRTHTATYGDGKLWPCTVAPGIPGSTWIPLTPNWRAELADVEPTCFNCPFAVA